MIVAHIGGLPLEEALPWVTGPGAAFLAPGYSIYPDPDHVTGAESWPRWVGIGSHRLTGNRRKPKEGCTDACARLPRWR